MPSPRLEIPPRAVVAAFAADGDANPLRGGQGRAWAIGEIVLKPLDMSLAELAWQSDVLGSLSQADFRVSVPLRTPEGSLIVEGWSAWRRLTDTHQRGRWSEIVEAGEHFHAAMRQIPRPTFIGSRQDPWAIGDRVAWGEVPIERYAGVKHLERLAAALKPISQNHQLIHGDLTGNVLFADGLPPAIIDFAPYWRPPGFASAIVVGDALLWEGADAGLVNSFSARPDFSQLLVRALIYRAVTDRLFRTLRPARANADDPFLGPVEIACTLAATNG